MLKTRGMGYSIPFESLVQATPSAKRDNDMAHPFKISLTEEERRKLVDLVSRGNTEKRLAERASIILDTCEGIQGVEIARRLQIQGRVVTKWRKRYLEHGLQGLQEPSHSGAPRKLTEEFRRRVFAVLEKRPPRGCARWTGRAIAEYLGDVTPEQVWRVLREGKGSGNAERQ